MKSHGIEDNAYGKKKHERHGKMMKIGSILLHQMQ